MAKRKHQESSIESSDMPTPSDSVPEPKTPPKRSYYYDDAHGYESYIPDEDEEDDDTPDNPVTPS